VSRNFPNYLLLIPPYGCNTEVNTQGVTSFYDAWRNCNEITEFPCVDSSAVTDFSYAWQYCESLATFPNINTSAGENFTYSWAYTGLTSFPRLNTSNGSIFYGTWAGCYYMTGTFPKLDFSEAVDFSYAWYYVSIELSEEESVSFPIGIFDSCKKNGLDFNNAWFGCYLSQTSVNNIIRSLDGTDTLSGYLDMRSCGSMPSATVINNNVINLWDKGWTVLLDYGSTGLPVPDYECSTSVNPAGEEYLAQAWKNCGLTEFPNLNVSSCKVFYETWYGNSFTIFPALNTSQGTNFNGAWQYCTSLTTFPAAMFDSCSATNFTDAWFNCALSQQSVDNILVSLDTAGQSDGIVNIFGGASAAPSAAGLAAKASLEGKG
jgi:hypothetical protein